MPARSWSTRPDPEALGGGQWQCVLVAHQSAGGEDYIALALDKALGCGTNCSRLLARRAAQCEGVTLARGELAAVMDLASQLRAWHLELVVSRAGAS